MYWLVLLVVIFLQNKFTSSWNSSNNGCASSLGCLLLPPNPESSKAREIDVSRKINTWHPVPKWKVFADASRNRTSFSSPYSEQDFTRENGDNFSSDDFSGIGDRKSRVELSESLNIKFLPLKDGNITIKSYTGKINESSTERVALFVVYSHVIHNEFPRTRNNSESMELEKKIVNGKENIITACKDSGDCNENSTVFVEPPIQNDNNSFTEKVITIPIMNNMTIEMKVGESDRNNYTVMIIPVHGNFTSMNDNVTGNVGNIIKIPLTQNMSLIMKSEGNLGVNNTFVNDSREKNINETQVENEGLELTENPEQLENTQSNRKEHNTEGSGESTISYFSTIYSEILENEYNSNGNDTLKIYSEEYNRSSEIENTYNLNTTIEKSSDKKEVRKLDETIEDATEQNENPDNITNMYHFYNNTFPNSNGKLQKFEYSKKFGPFEVKQLNSSSQPFIATFHIVIKNKDKGFSTDNGEYFLPNKTTTSASNDSKIQSSKIRENDERSKRSINKYVPLNTWKNPFQKDNGKQKFITNNYISNQNEHFTKYQRIPLNEARGTPSVVGLMNNDSLISQTENRKEQSNLSNLFSFSEVEDSYISSEYSESNEKFNQKGTNRLKNKGFIADETSADARGADGTKSNRIASRDENKREVASPTLIQNKDPREKHPEKSELQIVEEGSVDKYWEMKTPSGQLSQSEDIKTEKICDLKGGCSKINNSFNTVTVNESGYLKGNNSNKRAEKNEERDKNIGIYKRNLLLQESTQSVTRKEETEETVGMNKMPYKRELLYFKDTNRLKINYRPESESSISYSSKNKIRVPRYENIQKRFISKENGISQHNIKHNLRKNAYVDKISSDNFNANQANQNVRQAKFSQYLKNPINMPSTSNSLLRKKRSRLEIPFMLNDETVFYLMSFDDSPNGVLYNLRVNNNSFFNRNENKVDKIERQNVPLNSFQTNPLNARNNSGQQVQFIQAQPQNKVREWLRRGSKWPQNNGPTVLTDEREFQNRMTPTQNWFIIMPNIVEQENVGRNSAEPLFKNGKENRRNIQMPSEREREDEIYEDKEWVIVNLPTRKTTTTLPPNIKITTMPPRVNKPRDIINKPPRKSKFIPTQEPWSPEEEWEVNRWRVSRNPWKTIGTTPMMMMMGNGD